MEIRGNGWLHTALDRYLAQGERRRIEGREKSAIGRILGSSMQDNQSKPTQREIEVFASRVVH